MAYTNINLRKPNMTMANGYFYMFDEETEMLLQKTDDGVTAFSYPFDSLLTTEILSLEYDGINFWTLEEGDTSNTLTIKRWRIENYTCKLKGNPVLLNNVEHKFISNTFTVEHYHCNVEGGYVPDATIITLKSSMPGELLVGMKITIGPNIDGKFETHEVQHVDGDVITISAPLINFYADGDPLLFYNYFWVFNNANELDTSTGALYKINAYTGSIINIYPSGIYKDIKASTFSEISHFIEAGETNSLMYVKASNLLFIDITSPNLDYYGSMAMDTIEDNDIYIIEVYDIAVYNKNVYRLQLKATYFGNTVSWGVYSYQPATFQSMVSSISLSADPNIIAANEVSVSNLTARVCNQFLEPMVGALVYFDLDGGSGGTIITATDNTDSNGVALSAYRSGAVAELVVIVARVDQT